MCALGAKLLAVELLELPMVGSGSMLGFSVWSGTVPSTSAYNHPHTNTLATYVTQSQQQLELALEQVPSVPLIL
jgi:hypothetical protein